MGGRGRPVCVVMGRRARAGIGGGRSMPGSARPGCGGATLRHRSESHERTARDWDRGIRKIGNARLHPDGRRIDYKTGVTTTDADSSEPSLAAVEAGPHPRFLTVTEREMIADMHREGRSLRAIGRALGRPASTVKREIDARAVNGVYRPHRAQRAWAKSRADRRSPAEVSAVPAGHHRRVVPQADSPQAGARPAPPGARRWHRTCPWRPVG